MAFKVPTKPVEPKTERPARDYMHMARVKVMPCVICAEYGYRQNSPTQVHHCIHGRHGTRKVPDAMTIPLCRDHHLGDAPTDKVAVHREPAKWKDLYGEDTRWISWVEERL